MPALFSQGHVEPAELLHGGRNGLPHVGRVRHVERHEEACAAGGFYL